MWNQKSDCVCVCVWIGEELHIAWRWFHSSSAHQHIPLCIGGFTHQHRWFHTPTCTPHTGGFPHTNMHTPHMVSHTKHDVEVVSYTPTHTWKWFHTPANSMELVLIHTNTHSVGQSLFWKSWFLYSHHPLCTTQPHTPQFSTDSPTDPPTYNPAPSYTVQYWHSPTPCITQP